MPKSLYNEFLEIFELIRNLEPNDALKTLLSLIANDMHGKKSICAIYDKQSNVIKAISPSIGVEKNELISMFQFSFDRKSALKAALKKKSIYYTNDALNDPYFIKEFILSFDVTRVMLIPVLDASGKLFAAVYVDGEKDFGEEEIKKGKKWMKVLYPLLSYILKLRKTRSEFLSYAQLIREINPVIADVDPENALSMLSKGILKWKGLCGVKIELKREEGASNILINENHSTENECMDPALLRTVVRETPINHKATINIVLSYNRLSSIAPHINLLLNALSFTSAYLIRNRERHELSMKFSLLFMLSNALSKVKTEKELAETLTKILFEYGHYEDVSYLKYDKNLKKLSLLSQFTIIGVNIYTNYEQPVDLGILGKAIREKDTIIVNDTKESKEYYTGFPERSIFQSEAAIPLFYEGEPVAVLNIETTRKYTFTEEEQKFLNVLKHIIESKLSLILYERAVQKDRERLSILNKLLDEVSPKEEQDSILKKGMEVLQHVFGDDFTFYSAIYENGIITLKRVDGPVIELHKKDQPEEMLRSFATKTPSLLNFGGYSSVLIPFKECKERLGIFIQKRSGELTETIIEFLVFAANFLCKLIHNSILYKDLDMRLKEIGFLYNFSREITEAKNQDELFERTYKLIKSLFNVQDFYIALYSPDEDSIYLEVDYDGNVRQRKRVIPLSKSQGLTAWIIKQKRPVMINDWDREILSYPIVPLGNKSHKSYIGIPLMAENRVLGVIALQSHKKNHFSGHTLSLLSTIATQLSITLNNLNNVKKLKDLINRLEDTYNETLEALSHALDYREEETEYHSKRVAEYATLLAKRYGITDENRLRYIYWGGLLHDIGKIGIPDNILLKPGKLTEEEWNIMKKHVVIGYQILKGINFLRPALPLVLHHHEWWNGKGYPMGLKEEEIPVEARIFSVVDAFDAMTSDRPYRKAMSYKKAIEEIKRMSGIQFDPNVVKVFVEIPFDELAKINPSISRE